MELEGNHGIQRIYNILQCALEPKSGRPRISTVYITEISLQLKELAELKIVVCWKPRASTQWLEVIENESTSMAIIY